MRPLIHRVLVVDDDEVMRDLLEALLSVEGYEVTTGSSGQEALQLLSGEAGFDLVLTDLHMPGLEGKALTGALRQALPRGTLLLGMSGSPPDEGASAFLDGFVGKPFDANDLEHAIERAQQSRRNSQSAPQPQMPPASTGQDANAPTALDEAVFQALKRIIPIAQLGELYELTLNDIAKRHGRIEAALAAGDLAEAEREAHAIKGSCGMVGATELQALAGEIEGGTSGNTSAVAEIPAACLRLRRMLDIKLQTA